MSSHGFAASLFVAEHQVDPLVEMLRHKLALQRRPVLLKEVAGIWSHDKVNTQRHTRE